MRNTVALTLTGSAGTQSVPGLPGDGLDTVCTELAAQAAADGNGWNDLIISSNGTNLRALSPTNAMVHNPGLLAGYYDSYVTQVWQKYTASPPTVEWRESADYYANAITNHYARIVHATTIDGRGYAFPVRRRSPRRGR